MSAVHVYYRIPKEPTDEALPGNGATRMEMNGPRAVRVAIDRLNREWDNPDHWHLDSVGDAETFYSVSFRVTLPMRYSGSEDQHG